MNITELIKELEKIVKREGDLQVRWDSMSHSFPPDPVVRERAGEKVVILNP